MQAHLGSQIFQIFEKREPVRSDIRFYMKGRFGPQFHFPRIGAAGKLSLDGVNGMKYVFLIYIRIPSDFLDFPRFLQVDCPTPPVLCFI